MTIAEIFGGVIAVLFTLGIIGASAYLIKHGAWFWGCVVLLIGGSGMADAVQEVLKAFISGKLH